MAREHTTWAPWRGRSYHRRMFDDRYRVVVYAPNDGAQARGRWRWVVRWEDDDGDHEERSVGRYLTPEDAKSVGTRTCQRIERERRADAA